MPTVHRQGNQATNKYGPLPVAHKFIGRLCPGCEKQIAIGDFITYIPIGPGNDVEKQRLCRQHQVYEAVCVVVHWTCATGEVDRVKAQ